MEFKFLIIKTHQAVNSRGKKDKGRWREGGKRMEEKMRGFLEL